MATSFEELSPLTPAAQQLCRQLAIWSSDRSASLPPHTLEAEPSRRAARVALWRAHAQLAASANGDRSARALETLGALKQLDGLCADALARVQRANGCLELVAQRHAGLEAQSGALQRQTASHSGRRAGLQALVDALDARLGPFRALATHRRLLESPGLSATHPDLLPALEALDRAIADISSSLASVRESATVMAELRQLQARGLRPIAAHVTSALQTASASAAVALREWYAEPPPGGHAATLLSPSDGAYVTAMHVRFQALGAQLRPWLEQLERRALMHREASAVLSEVHASFLSLRAPLLEDAVRAILSRLTRAMASAGAGGSADSHAASAAGISAGDASSATALAHVGARLPSEQLAEAARRAIGWMNRMCYLEVELHALLFVRQQAGAGGGGAGGAGSSGSVPSSGHAAMLAALEGKLGASCQLLAHWLRPAVLGADAVESLADLALVLREESAASPSPSSASLSTAAASPHPSVLRACVRILGDVQGRLAFKTQVEIRDRVRAFRPALDDVDYPARLERAREAAIAERRARLNKAALAAADSAASASASASASAEEGVGLGAADGGAGVDEVSYTAPWYPPVDSTLRCLAVLYRAVDRLTFSSLAHEAVVETTAALLDGSRRVAALHGEVHGRLFLVRQLLTLREQLAPFDAEWEVVEKSLDLSGMRGWLVAELTSRRAIARPLAFVRGLWNSNRIVVVEQHRDAKAALESELKTACEALIGCVSSELTAPLLTFLAEYAHAASHDEPDDTGSAQPQQLPSAEACKRVLADATALLAERLPVLHGTLALYLNNPVTLSILFRPVKAAVSDALQQYAAIVQRALTDEQRDALDMPGLLEGARAALDACG